MQKLKSSSVQFPTGRSLRSFVYVLMAVFSFSLSLLWNYAPIAAQGSGVNQAVVIEILDSDQVFIQNKRASKNDQANRGQRISTRNARTALKFNTGAIGRLGRNSSLVVGDRCARIRQGSILVNGQANTCSGSAVAGVRGTTYLLEVDENNQTQIKVLEGEVQVMSRMSTDAASDPEGESPDSETTLPSGDSSSPGTQPKSALPKQFGIPRPSMPLPTSEPASGSEPATEPVTTPADDETETVIKSGEKVTIDETSGTVGEVQTMSLEEFQGILKGSLFSGFSIQLPGISKIEQSFRNLFPGVPFPINIPNLNVPGIPGVPGLPF